MTVLMMAGIAITSANNVPFRKIFSVEIFTSPFSEFGSNFKNVILLLYKYHS
jgi:hypothetical protein